MFADLDASVGATTIANASGTMTCEKALKESVTTEWPKLHKSSLQERLAGIELFAFALKIF